MKRHCRAPRFGARQCRSSLFPAFTSRDRVEGRRSDGSLIAGVTPAIEEFVEVVEVDGAVAVDVGAADAALVIGPAEIEIQ